MGKRALATEIAFLDHFLGIVPSTTGIGHEYSQREASRQAAYQQAEYTSNAEDDTYDNRDGNSQQGGENHLMLSGTGGNLDTRAIVGSSLTIEDARNLAELVPNLFDHFLGSTSDSLHGETTK